MLSSHNPPGPEKQKEVWDGDATGREEKTISLPARPAFPPLCLCLFSLPWICWPHRLWAEHSTAPATSHCTPGQHQGGRSERGWKHLMGAGEKLELSCGQWDCKFLEKCKEHLLYFIMCGYHQKLCTQTTACSSGDKSGWNEDSGFVTFMLNRQAEWSTSMFLLQLGSLNQLPLLSTDSVNLKRKKVTEDRPSSSEGHHTVTAWLTLFNSGFLKMFYF